MTLVDQDIAAARHAVAGLERSTEALLRHYGNTGDGQALISQRDFDGHRYARLAHVGDRTGLELIRTLQQRAVALGMDVFMECTVTRLLTAPDGSTSGAFGSWRESGRFITWCRTLHVGRRVGRRAPQPAAGHDPL